MKTIAAVVVTFNRLRDLEVCIASLRAQTRPVDAILVINNGSTDGTDRWLAVQADLQVITQPNLGGAGGFATGISTAYNQGFDGLWCMDDDCVADVNALKMLLLSPEVGPAIKNCMSISSRDSTELAFYVDRPNRNYRKAVDMVDCDIIYGVASFFNGTLIWSEVVKAVGIPDKSLFIWGDEVEYMTRVIRAGFPVVTVPKAIFYHPPSFDRNGLPWPGAWKQYYAVRNQRRVFQNIHGRKYGMAVYLRWVARMTMKQLTTAGKNRIYNFLLYVEAGLDSLLNRFTKTPDKILTLMLYRRQHR